MSTGTHTPRNCNRRRPHRHILAILAAMSLVSLPARGEVILQYFNTSWRELAGKMPELAEAGYGSLWLPPPTKASGGLSVGYDCWDPFDLGSRNQRGSVSTRYGTEADLLALIETAHRFGIRVYFDNIMNHRAFDVPGYNADTAIDIYPGMVPEDFHLRVTEEGIYRKWDNVANWQDTWQIQNRNFSDLIDIAQESPDNGNFGTYEGDHVPKIHLVRHPDNPEYYCYAPSTNGATYVGFNSPSITKEMLVDPANAWLYEEDVNAYLMRAVRWLVDRTKVDGLRLDAVKHVPDYFFGMQSGTGKDESSAGYCGQAQEQFNLTRGFSDANHRDTVFLTDTAHGHGRDDLMLFGEHLGEPPGVGGYIDAGMRLVDSKLHGFLNGNIGSPWGTLDGLQESGGQGFSAAAGVPYVKSHDDDYATRPGLQFAYILTREGLPNVYTDGNHQAETLGESGGAFPRHANINFLGQFGDNRIPNLCYIHNHFARGSQKPRWGDGDVVAFERIDKRERVDMSDTDGCVLFFIMCDNFTDGQYREIDTSFPAGARLWQYATGGGNFYYDVPGDQKIKVIVPPGGYFAFSWRSPEESDLWAGSGGKPITIYEGGHECGWVAYDRQDGPDGDSGFNPYGVADTDPTDFTYTYYVPRISSSTNVRFAARVDGSCANLLMKLDGGVDLNGNGRDNPPALANDIFLGYEQANSVRRTHREKFAARDTEQHNVIGSDGAETYEVTAGSAGFTVNDGMTGRDSDEGTASWFFHDPEQTNDTGALQFSPLPEHTAGSNVTVWTKVGYELDINRAYLYYTVDGTTYPEGAAGEGRGATKTVEMLFDHADAGNDTIDWWKGVIPAADVQSGTVLRYKIGCFAETGTVIFPFGEHDIATKKQMLNVWDIPDFDPGTATYHPHNDYVGTATGLAEGFHVLRARAFLKRDDPIRASIYNTFVQTFYYDASKPGGEILYPREGDSLGQNENAAVVRTDRTVTEVWYNIEDALDANDDGTTGNDDGNGTNAVGAAAWVRASEVTPTPGVSTSYPHEWRFSYRNIPPNGSNATIRVRLMEISSSTNMTLSDAKGHFTTLERNVWAWGPNERIFFHWPDEEGMIVKAGWAIRARFTKSLGDGLNDAELLDRFLVTIDGAAQGKDLYRITRDVDGENGELEYDMPNVYTGNPDDLHRITVTHEKSGGVVLQTTRYVRTQPADKGPHIDIVNPPEFDSDGKPYEIVLPDVADPQPEDRQFTIRVETDLDARHVWLVFTNSVGYWAPYDDNPSTNGTRMYWHYLWTNLMEGTYRFIANVNTNTADTGEIHGHAVRNARVILRESSTNDVTDLDDDDDGLYDYDEVTPTNLPSRLSETWLSGDVHIWQIYGRTANLLPDTDGDNLPDGLESGWRSPISTEHTDVTEDTNGDGYPNFIADLDPPFYNTVPDNNGLPNYVFKDSRARLIHGTMTDPNNPDSDYDGLPDGIEDWNRNGWVDGDGNALHPGTGNPWDDRPSQSDWPDGKWDAAWTETDPNNADTDGDSAKDGYAEDRDRDGWIAGDINSNRLYDAGETWGETDPLNPDTDGDGLPDGWEYQYDFDPLNNGIAGHTNMGTGLAMATNSIHGANGNPDGDSIVIGGVTQDYVNVMEYLNGTNPRIPDSGDPPPAGSIEVGPGPEIGTVAGRTYYEEFMDWPRSACLVLDAYEGAGGNNQSGDLYLGWDGWDTSRDIVAFYALDGGDIGNGGDGKFYFRLDFHDLQKDAEEGNLDLYVVIDFNSPDSGEMKLPDDVDTLTHMKWEAVVAVYESSKGAVYVDDPANPSHTTSAGDILSANGVDRRDQGDAHGFIDAYFNHELDAVEFSISRQALLDAGWSGSRASNLNYQVFCTKDGTQNSPVGAGDIGGRSDIRDSIKDDWIAEDYWQSQEGLKSELWTWINGTDRAGRAKVSVVLHGNQAIQPGCKIQDLVNTGEGAGLYRPLDAHGVFQQPVSMHITPTLASAIEWAAVDPDAGKPWRDGPALNRRIAKLAATNIVHLMGSTFSDHMLPYFTKTFNRDNETLARQFLEEIYGVAITPASSVFWTPERLLDKDVCEKILDMGYGHTVVDQNTHIFNWFGREESLRDGGYRLNEIDGVRCFVINDIATSFMFDEDDHGASIGLRALFNRKGRDGTQDQVVTLFSSWETFTDNDKADSYDWLVRWCANRPWTAMVSLNQIAAGEIDAWGDVDGETWATVNRGTIAGRTKQAHNWLNHASMGDGDNGDFDNWYLGGSREEGLQEERFEIRPGTNVSERYGMQITGGLSQDAWNAVNSIADTNLSLLARCALHASVFQTAFHNEDNHDLRRYSTGRYMYPATSYNTLASLSRNAQSQTRIAAVYERVDDWATGAASLTTTTTETADVDLDGETEFLLYNGCLFALFERTGGRLVGVWVRDKVNGVVYQTVGNPTSYAGIDTEEEGTFHVAANGDGYEIGAYRTSALKDWWNGSRSYVNDVYTFAAVADGWTIESSDGQITKTVTLLPDATALEVAYVAAGTLYVRNGLSPNLRDLLTGGQGTLAPEDTSGGVLSLANTNYMSTVSAQVGYADGGHSTAFNASAVDEDTNVVDFTTVNMRNQAQTHQVELRGTSAFAFSLGFEIEESDWDGDGMPNAWEDRYGLETNAQGEAGDDADGDTARNRDEYVAGTNPLDGDDVFAVSTFDATSPSVIVRFPTKPWREYFIGYANNTSPTGSWRRANSTPIKGTGAIGEWVDDGSRTTPSPADTANRFYKVTVRIAQ